MEAQTTTRRTIKRPAMKLVVAEQERVVLRPPTPEPAVDPESSEPESSDDETESVRSEPVSEDVECQTEQGFAFNLTQERRVYGIVDDQISHMEENLEEKLAKMRREMMEETERMLAQKLATLAVAHPAIQKQSKKAEKEKKKEEEVRGFYEVPAGQDEIARLRKLNRDLRKESEGKTNTNRKLQEKSGGDQRIGRWYSG